MGLMSVRLGSNDVAKATAFYDAIFAELGLCDIKLSSDSSAGVYCLPGGVYFMIAPPRDGQLANHGNGDTLGFTAPDAAAVDRWHAAGIAQGGRCEGEPGSRKDAGGRYGAYLRDPDGHKLCAYAGG